MANATFSPYQKKEHRRPDGSKDPKGKFHVALNLEGHKTARFGGYGEAAARTKGIQIVAEYLKDPEAFFNKSKLKGSGIQAKIEEFCGDRGVKEKTDKINRDHLEPFFEETGLSSETQIDKYVLRRHKQNLKARGAAPGTIRIRLRIVRAFVRFCLEKGYLKKDPWPNRTTQQQGGGEPLIPAYKSSGYYYEEEEEALLRSLPLNATPSRTDLDRAIKLALWQGWREHHVWSFCWARLDLKNGRYTLPDMKGAPSKSVKLLARTLELIRGLGVPQEVPLSECSQDDHDCKFRIFSRWGDENALSHAFTKLRRSLDIPKGRFHDLKHTCVSKMIEAGCPLKRISEFTNTSVAALQHYVHADKKAMETFLESYDPNVRTAIVQPS